MGTLCRITFQSDSREIASEFAIASTQWIADFETKYSRFRDDSIISKINRSAGIEAIETDQDANHIFDLSSEIFFSTYGLMDVTALPLTELWNYHGHYNRIPTESEIANALNLVGWGKVERSPNSIFLPQKGMKLDIGGFGKEYAVDRVAEITTQYGIDCYLIDFGRDIRLGSPPPGQSAWNIGIADPSQIDHTNGTLHLSHQAVATSGNYIRNFQLEGKTYGHMVDPRIGHPISQSALSATVIANTCLEAGRISTTACILGLEEGLDTIENSFGAEGTLSYNNKHLTTVGFYEYAILN